jgi:hypothetical protein
MPTFDVDVENATYEVDAPDERTAWAWANIEHRKQKESITQDVEKMRQGGAVERFGQGALANVENIGYGLKGLVSDLTPEQQRDVAVNKAFLEGVKGEGIRAENLGSLATDIASFAVPGGLAVKGARMLPAAMKLAKAAPILAPLAGETALTAGLSAAYSPEDRGTAALAGGAGGAVGGLASRALGKVAGGLITPSEEAKQLMEQGVNVPVWKATENKLLRGAVERAKALPITKSFVSGQERGALESANKTWFSKATPPSPVLDEAGNVLRWEMDKPVKNIGSEGIQELTDKFDDAYKALYKGRVIPIDDTYKQEIRSTINDVKKYYPRVSEEFNAAVTQADDLLREGTRPIRDLITGKITKGREGVSPEALKVSIDSINKRITEAWNKGEASLAESLSGVRNSLTDLRVRGLPPEVASMAKPINAAYANFKQLQKAAQSPVVQREGVITPDRMLSAIRSTDITPGKSAFARGAARNQPDVVVAARVLGNELPNVGPGTAEKLLFPGMLMAPSVLGADFGIGAGLAAATSAPGQKFLLGGYGYQKALQDALRNAAPYFGVGGGLSGYEFSK